MYICVHVYIMLCAYLFIYRSGDKCECDGENTMCGYVVCISSYTVEMNVLTVGL